MQIDLLPSTLASFLGGNKATCNCEDVCMYMCVSVSVSVSVCVCVCVHVITNVCSFSPSESEGSPTGGV